MYETKIDLSEKSRRNVIVLSNDRLAEAIDLQHFTGTSRDLDKYLWFLEAHLQEKA
jgi:DNA-binding ferritin-like protein